MAATSVSRCQQRLLRLHAKGRPMGLVRFVLAMIVVADHGGVGTRSIGAFASVDAFFVLSGVYMAAVYTTKYAVKPDGLQLFYVNRALRLWPTYLVILAATYALYLVVGGRFNDLGIFTLFAQPDTSALWYVIPSAIFLFGQDLVSLNGYNHGMLPVRQSWSIATELLFYLAVPYIYRRSFSVRYGLAIFALGMAGKIFSLIYIDWRVSYFFPLWNMGYFALGMVLYHASVSRSVIAIRAIVPYTPHLASAAIIILVFWFGPAAFGTPGDVGTTFWNHLVFLGMFCPLVMFAFADRSNGLDLYLGNISYGVYLNHFVLMAIVVNFTTVGPVARFALVMISSVVLSALTEYVLQRPIDHFRRNVRFGARLQGEPARTH